MRTTKMDATGTGTGTTLTGGKPSRRVSKPTAKDSMQRAMDALAAADVYVTRLVHGLQELAFELRDGDVAAGREALTGAVAGVHCLADILAAVRNETGIDTPASTDQELGHVALALSRIAALGASGSPHAVATIVEDELIPALTRLAPTFPHLEAHVASLV